MTNAESKVDAALDRAIAALPIADVDEWRREKIRRDAHLALGKGARSRWLVWYDRVFEPVLVGGVAFAYVGWAIQMLSFIHQ